MSKGRESYRSRALVIVPTYNERDNVDSVARRLFDATDDVDLLFIDDGSPDDTAEAIKALAAENERVNLIERPSKQGLRSAYVTGFDWAMARAYPAMIEMDADLSHDPADVPRLLEALEHADLVIGSRYVAGGKVENWGRARRSLSRWANTYARAWLRLPVRDSTAGFRAYRSDALVDGQLATLRSEGYAFQIEMTRRVHRAGRPIVEMPITFSERIEGTSKMSLRIVFEALFYVTAWGARDRVRRLLRQRVRPR